MKNKVKAYRKAAGLTQVQLAKMVHVSARTIISIEKEQYSPSLMLAYRLAQIFKISVETLCCLEENKQLEDKEYESL
ncbi:helix-turn-helix transcriptional regulator [uncultured Secundilactobacillus sp.]|uniref:helix-turn-helix transcriptional regulator n=1 Tax=uncultured Secundilactobacillus sp. TaxID=2813935 RepID=UPI00258E9E42|nr:helix-turn-helix transcriptional regulator [uncultured Secundilactobacillus sp.]